MEVRRHSKLYSVPWFINFFQILMSVWLEAMTVMMTLVHALILWEVLIAHVIKDMRSVILKIGFVLVW